MLGGPSSRIWRAIACLLLAAAVTFPAPAAGGADPRLAEVAKEARQTIAVINWFYVRHRACPQPSRPAEIAILERELGDGYSAETRGRFLEIHGISMRSGWLYYASPQYPDRCMLLRKIGADPTLIWRRHNGGRWTQFDPGDGRGERPINLTP
jgi:hypothetical protein